MDATTNRIRPENLDKKKLNQTEQGERHSLLRLTISPLPIKLKQKYHHENSPSATVTNLPSSKILVYFSLNLLSKIAYIFAYYNSESVVGKLGVE